MTSIALLLVAYCSALRAQEFSDVLARHGEKRIGASAKVDAIVFGALATSVLTPIESPIRDFLRSQPALVAYADHMRARFFPELATAPSRGNAAQTKGTARAVQIGA
jgi:Glutathione S-transferase, C-terminal domain